MIDSSFRIGVVLGGIVLAGVITYAQFCGQASLPAKPPPLQGPQGTGRQMASSSSTTPAAYLEYLKKDAEDAGVRTPTIDEMEKKLAYQSDASRHVLEPGAPAIAIAGLQLYAEHQGGALALEIKNLLPSDVAYRVKTEVIGAAGCTSIDAAPVNAIVIARGATETRTECAWSDGISLAVTKVETLEVGPLSSFYLSETPPGLLGIDPRISRGHRGVESKDPCSPTVPQVVSAGLARGDIAWRDLVDFYARHRCQSFQFPISYRAFNSDGERSLPAAN